MGMMAAMERETAPHPIKDAEPVEAPQDPPKRTDEDGPGTAEQNATAGPSGVEPRPESTVGGGGGDEDGNPKR